MPIDLDDFDTFILLGEDHYAEINCKRCARKVFSWGATVEAARRYLALQLDKED